MRLLIAGGRLQGVEAVYLAQKLGWEMIVVDRNENAAASKMCDEFHCIDIADSDKMLPLVKSVDAVLPALEELAEIEKLEQYCEISGVPFLFDVNAYRLSSSKLQSDRFFAENNISAPKYYPEAEFPLIAKPSDSSGSEDVRIIESREELAEIDFASTVVQEYLRGCSYSLEVVGNGATFDLLQITEIVTDGGYDCKCVVADPNICIDVKAEFYAIARRIAELVKVCGVFDIEVIASPSGLKVIEIDARLPSQTPICVLHSTDVNVLERMYRYHTETLAPQSIVAPNAKRAAIYRQILVENGRILSLGEHVLANRGALAIRDGLFGSDCMITDYACGKSEWAAAVIITGDTLELAESAFMRVIENIEQETGIQIYEE